MHPINKNNFGTKGIAVSYYNGTSVVPGYIVKQVAVNKFKVTDGTTPKIALLAPSTLIATNLGSTNPKYFTILAYPSTVTSKGATFVANYGVSSAVVVAGGTGFAPGVNTLTLTSSGGATLTVTASGGGVITSVGAVATPGTVTTLLTNPVVTTGGTGTGATFTLTYKLLTITPSGGTGYIVGETLTFNGLVATVRPTATITTISGAGAPTGFSYVAGSGITAKATSFGTTGVAQHVAHIYDNRVITTEGHFYGWAINSAIEADDANLPSFS
jgi:hypothetical protein